MVQTNFNEVTADKFTGALVGAVTGNVTGNVTGSLIGTVTAATVEKADNYALTASEKLFVINAKMTAGSKTLTLGLAAGQVAIVYNYGTETITVKNVAGDSGTSLATTKMIIITGSTTADASVVVALN